MASAASPAGTTNTGDAADDRPNVPSPDRMQPYPVIAKKRVSPDSCVLRFGLPEERDCLGFDADLPTCVAVRFDDDRTDDEPLKKSYSPISHPSETDGFDLLVKAYPYRPGGGVGDYLCNLRVGDSVLASVKKPRQIHGSPQVKGRWRNVGLVGGGTGIAPLYQLLVILLAEPVDKNEAPTKIWILSVNRHKRDILMKKELDDLADTYPDRVTVTYSLTGDRDDDTPSNVDGTDDRDNVNATYGRGDVEMARSALPPPSNADGSTMIFVCGKDGFVSTWGGPVIRGPPPPGAKKGPKIQGPLLGILKDAGYDESEVFKY